MIFRAIHPSPYAVKKLAIPLIKNKTINPRGSSLIVCGSRSTKLPSNKGFIMAAKPVSVAANTAIAKIAAEKTSQ